jgi:cell wall-associated NlpC family hydrolase
MNINKGKLTASLIATSIVLPMSVTIAHADNIQQINIEYRIITANSVNFRTGPSTSHSSIGKLNKGNKVEYIGKSGEWTNIKYNGNVGYVHANYVSASSNKDSSSNNKDNTIKSTKVVTGGSVNLRTGPSTSYSKITTLSKGSEVGFISVSNGWAKINYNGSIGYMSSQYLGDKTSSNLLSSNKADKIIDLAKTLLEKKYVWGSEGPNTFDCSGFTQYVFKKAAGISLPRVSRDQSKFGQSVSKSQLQKGDLVFFDTEGSNNGNVTHVAIYMGNNKIIHASSSKGKVVISELDSYSKSFVNARRVL